MLLLVSLLAVAPPVQEPVASIRDVQRLVARVERVDRIGLTLTLRAENDLLHTLNVDQQFTLFDELKSGDIVRVRFAESIVVAVPP
jgi:hypothetical protein